MMLSPWLRYFLTYDPTTALREVRCPVLAINGSLDLQVPPRCQSSPKQHRTDFGSRPSLLRQ